MRSKSLVNAGLEKPLSQASAVAYQVAATQNIFLNIPCFPWLAMTLPPFPSRKTTHAFNPSSTVTFFVETSSSLYSEQIRLSVCSLEHWRSQKAQASLAESDFRMLGLGGQLCYILLYDTGLVKEALHASISPLNYITG